MAMTLDQAASAVVKEIKALLENEDGKNEFYGTISLGLGGAPLIRIDGADSPVQCTCTVAVNQGDRVMCHIVNHRVVVFANITAPVTDDSTAQIAVNRADVATQAANEAGIVAAAAQQSADSAAQAASVADSKAAAAGQAASAAQQSASAAAQAASVADGKAVAAGQAAEAAQSSADSAATAAGNAWDRAGDALTAARSAQASANAANTYSNAALDQLAVVQDVAGILTWASEHGSFELTQDQSIVDGKVYFTYDSTTHDYTPVVDPQASALSTYYELTVDEAMNDFIMAHLAVTTRGLWVLPAGLPSTDQTVDNTVDKASSSDTSAQKQANANARKADDYKVLLSNDGLYVYDGDGVLVSTFGESITFSSLRQQYIGNEDAYILFTPASGSTAGSITIGGANVTLGSGKKLSELLEDVEAKAARGTGILHVTTAPSSYTTTQGGFTPSYRMSLSTAKSQAGVAEVIVGDIVEHDSWHYPVGYVSSSYVYMGERVSIKGDTGPEAVVDVTVDSIDWSAGTATLRATLKVDGTAKTSGVAYKWTKGTSTTSLGTGQTHYTSGSGALNASYSCACTWTQDGQQATQSGSIDLAVSNSVKLVADGYYSSVNNDLSTNYYTKSDFTVSPSEIASRVSAAEVALKGSFATCSTSAGTQNKAATITPSVTGWTLYSGATVTVRFSNANTNSSPQLNVNSTGAKPVKDAAGNNLSESACKWAAGSVFTFTYDGTNWRMQDSSLVDRLSAAESSITQNAGNIELKVSESDVTGNYLVGKINLDSTSATISAERVEINGTAIFTAIKNDVKGVADDAVSDLDQFVRGYAYMPTDDATAVDGVTYYYRTPTYSEASVTAGVTDVSGMYELVGWDYVLTSDEVAESGKTYYERTPEYVQAAVSADDDVSGLYELVSGEYVPTEDDVAQQGKQYFRMLDEFEVYQASPGDNVDGKFVYVNVGSVVGSIGSVSEALAESIAEQAGFNDGISQQVGGIRSDLESFVKIDPNVPSVTVGYMDQDGVYANYRSVLGSGGMEIVGPVPDENNPPTYEDKSVAFYGATQRLGAEDAPHMVADGDTLMFLPAGASSIGEAAAYIDVDENNEGQLHIARASVDHEMRFGDFVWFERTNGNLALKWTGAE